MFGQDFDVKVWSKDFEFWNLIKICVRTCFFGKQNSTLGSVVPLAMLLKCRPPLSAGLLVPSMDHNLQTRNRPREGESGSIQLWRASRNPLEACRLKFKQT